MRGCLVDFEDGFDEFERKQARYSFDEFRRNIDYPINAEESIPKEMIGSSEGKLCTPYKFFLNVDPQKAMKHRQRTGDCVSIGLVTASDIRRVWEFAKLLEREQYIARQCSALPYSGRGHTGQGADPYRLSMWHLKSGFLLEQLFTDADGKEWDFRNYDEYYKIGIKYGRTGLPDSIISITSQHAMRRAQRVRDTNALADLMWSGYTAHLGSNLGVANTGDPISPRRGSWAHDMAPVGFDDTRKYFNFRVWLWDQSWGPSWNRVTNIPQEWLPWGEGMFAISEETMQYAIKQGGCVVFDDANGFQLNPIDFSKIVPN